MKTRHLSQSRDETSVVQVHRLKMPLKGAVHLSGRFHSAAQLNGYMLSKTQTVQQVYRPIHRIVRC